MEPAFGCCTREFACHEWPTSTVGASGVTRAEQPFQTILAALEVGVSWVYVDFGPPQCLRVAASAQRDTACKGPLHFPDLDEVRRTVLTVLGGPGASNDDAPFQFEIEFSGLHVNVHASGFA